MPKGSSFTILYVDDDRQIAELVSEILTAAGYRVLVATDPEQALQVLATASVDLLMTDIIMPGKNGVELARAAKALRPQVKIMFVTGYAQKSVETDALRLGRIMFKPVRSAEIVQSVRSLLAA